MIYVISMIFLMVVLYLILIVGVLMFCINIYKKFMIFFFFILKSKNLIDYLY